MSIINKFTGYKGFTIHGFGNSYGIDSNGLVKHCMVSIRFPRHEYKVNVDISKGVDDWAARMGDGSIIPLSAPVVLYSTKDSAIVLFDLSIAYPANSPMTLVYRSDTARITINDTYEPVQIVNNMVCGIFAMTVNNDNQDSEGYVNTLIATFPFQYKIANVGFYLNQDASSWKVRMGDGSIINLSNGTILAVNKDNAVIRFTMSKPYPSNSPGILLYGSTNAWYRIEENNSSGSFVPVDDVNGFPSLLCVTDTFDLNTLNISPYNATNRDIIVDGSSSLFNVSDNGSVITCINEGSAQLKIKIINGKGSGSNFTKTFSFRISRNVISIKKQPLNEYTQLTGDTAEFSISAESSMGYAINYQWYHNTSKSINNATPVQGETSEVFHLPSNNSAGIHYYFCKLTSSGAANTIYSNFIQVTTNVKLLGINISPSSVNMTPHSTKQLSIVTNPIGISPGNVAWFTDNPLVATVSSNGLVSASINGECNITCKTLDGKFSSSIKVIVKFIPVTNVTIPFTSMISKTEFDLNPTIIPSNATNKNIIWSVITPANNNNYRLNGNKITMLTTEILQIECRINSGCNPGIDYSKTFSIPVSKLFIPVSDIVLSNDITQKYYVGSVISLNASVIPNDADYKYIVWSSSSNNVVINNNNISITSSGSIKLKATIKNGKGNGVDFTKEYILGNISEMIIPVSNISCLFIHTNENGSTSNTNIFDPSTVTNGQTVLPIKVYPDNATNKNISNIEYTVYATPRKDEYFTNIPDSLWTIKSDIPSDQLSFDKSSKILKITYNKLPQNYNYKILFQITINNGKGDGVNFIDSFIIYIKPMDCDVEYPLEDLTLLMPNHTRAMYPLLLTRHRYTPDNAHGIDIIKNKMPPEKTKYTVTTTKTNVQLFNPAEGDQILLTVKPRPIFNYGFSDRYVLPWNPGTVHIDVTLKECTVSNLNDYNVVSPNWIDFHKRFDIEILDPFIPILNILLNISQGIVINQEHVLCPEFDTGKGIDSYNPYWDEELPTYSDIKWSVISGNAVITRDGRIKSTSTGVVKIMAVVDSGTQEYLEWYSPSTPEPKIDYSQEFSINVINQVDYIRPIVTLIMTNGSSIEISKLSDFMNLCNDLPGDASIKLTDNRTFVKNQVRSIRFGSGWVNRSMRLFRTFMGNETYEQDKYTKVVTTCTLTIGVAYTDNTNNTSPNIEWGDFTTSKYRGTFGLRTYQFSGNSIIYTSSKQDARSICAIDVKYTDLYGDKISYSRRIQLYSDKDLPTFELVTVGINNLSFRDTIIVRRNKSTTKYDAIEESLSNVINFMDCSGDPNFDKPPNDFISFYQENNIMYTFPDYNTSGGNAPGITATYNRSTNKIKLTFSDSIQPGRYKLRILSFKYLPPITTFTNSYMVYCRNTSTEEYTKEITIGYYNEFYDSNHKKEVFMFLINRSSGKVFSNDSITACSSVDQIKMPWTMNYNISDFQVFLTNAMFSSYDDIINEGIKINSSVPSNSNPTYILDPSKFTWSKLAENYTVINVTFTMNFSSSYPIYIGNNRIRQLAYNLNPEMVTRDIIIDVRNEYEKDASGLTLKNFGRNFTSLTTIDCIPPVNGTSCLENFLRGCTSFNADINIPDGVNGDKAFKYFLRDCISFNSRINLPNGIYGVSILHGFLYGCINFNQDISIPESVTGKQCLDRFLYGCIKFNKSITLPRNLKGYACMREFLSECTSFNQPITLPDDVRDQNDPRREFCNMMKNCKSYCSTITVPRNTGINGELSEQAISSDDKNCALINNGVTISGDGSADFLRKVTNTLSLGIPPFRRFTNLD